MSRVAARCLFGFPAAVETLPYDADGRPFPTLFYLTCPTLVAAVSRLESDGGVQAWSARVAAAPEPARAVAAAATRADQACTPPPLSNRDTAATSVGHVR